MSLMPPTPLRLVPGLLRARGLKVSVDRIRDALQCGAVPGRREQRYWVLTPEDVDAAERYFREVDTSGGQKAGAAAVEEAKRRESWLGLFGQVFGLDRWSVCRVQAAAICGSRVK
jgi:hypothetical protein